MSLCHQGLLNIGHDIAGGCTTGDQYQKKSDRADASMLYHCWLRPLFKTIIEISYFFSRFFSACSIGYSQQSLTFSENDAYIETRSKFSNAWQSHFESILISFSYLRAILRIRFDSFSKNLMTKTLDIVNLFEYYLHFSAAWLQKKSEALFLMVQPFLVAHADGHNPHEVDIVDLKKLIPKISDLLVQDSLVDNTLKCGQDTQVADIKQLIPDDEKWMILGACLWQHMSRFMIYNLNMVLDTLEDGNQSGSFHRKYDSRASTPLTLDSDSINLPEQIRLVSLSLCELLKTTVTLTSSFHIKQLAAFLWQKLENDLNVMTLEWLKRPSLSEFNQSHEIVNLEVVNRKDKFSVLQILWDHCADPKLISDCFVQEKLNWSNYLGHLPTKGWNDMYITMTGLHKTDDTHDYGWKVSSSSSSHDVGSPVKRTFQSGHASLSSHHKDTTTRTIALFQNPREIHKRNGELLEVIFLF